MPPIIKSTKPKYFFRDSLSKDKSFVTGIIRAEHSTGYLYARSVGITDPLNGPEEFSHFASAEVKNIAHAAAKLFATDRLRATIVRLWSSVLHGNPPKNNLNDGSATSPLYRAQ